MRQKFALNKFNLAKVSMDKKESQIILFKRTNEQTKSKLKMSVFNFGGIYFYSCGIKILLQIFSNQHAHNVLTYTLTRERSHTHTPIQIITNHSINIC